MRELTAAAVLAVSALAGCLPRDLDWSVRFASEELQDRAVLTEAFVLRGGCDSTDTLYVTEVEFVIFSDPPELSPGTYGFGARARDQSCEWYADGCTSVELPSDDGEVRVLLQAIPPEPGCDVESCSDGECQP